ncbi:MAG: aldehyde dehydrogenase family protein, partial [Lysobacterales bacterium]
MNTALQGPAPDQASAISARLRACLELQRQTYLAQPNPGLQQRKADLLQLKRMISENRETIIGAINLDYGNRSRHETLIAEILFVLDSINFIRSRLRNWMKPQKRHVDFMTYPGAHNRVIPQPLGVVGVIVPWNFPIQLSFGPLAYIFSAGNRAIVKMSENSGALARLLIEICPRYFPPEKLAFFEETGEVGIQFSRLPFDHLLFTGSAQTGRDVMAAAAKNLT